LGSGLYVDDSCHSGYRNNLLNSTLYTEKSLHFTHSLAISIMETARTK
jgi:hypothetical protein